MNERLLSGPGGLGDDLVWVVEVAGEASHQHIQLGVRAGSPSAARRKARNEVAERYGWPKTQLQAHIITCEGKPLQDRPQAREIASGGDGETVR